LFNKNKGIQTMKRNLFGGQLDIYHKPMKASELLSADSDAYAKRVAAEKLQAEQALYQRYGAKRPAYIDTETKAVLHGMAQDLGIPAFMQNEPRVGKPPKWNGQYGFTFGLRVILLKSKNKNMSTRSAIAAVQKKYKYSGTLDGLVVRYNELQQNDAFITLSKLAELGPQNGTPYKDTLEEFINILNQ